MEEGTEMRKKFCMISLAAAMTLGLTACGNAIPDMTDAQMQAISEYAAVTLLKYDVDHRSRLVDLELVAQEEARRKELAEEEALRQEQEAEAAGEESGAAGDTPVAGADGVPEIEPISMEEALGLPEGVSITYREIMACDSYPDGDADFFSLTAGNGRRFLVLKFDILNGSGQDQSIDILSQEAAFRVTVNGDIKRNAMTTMLQDDLTTYKDTITTGSSVEAVLVVEVDSSVADSMWSLSFEIRNDTKTYMAQIL